MLENLADIAGRQARLSVTGPYHYIRTGNWVLATSMTTRGNILDAQIVANDREQWLAADGSGRVEVTRSGDRASISGVYASLVPTVFLPDEASDQVAAKLYRQHPEYTAGQWLRFVSETWRNQAVQPNIQEALLRVLSEQDDISASGSRVDRAGRVGIEFHAVIDIPAEPRTRHLLVLDSNTGTLLSSERVALEQAGDILIEVPAPIEYIVWLERGLVANTDTRP